MSILEWLGVITGAGCVWLAVRQHIANWPIGIANNVLMFFLFVPKKLYADAALQLLYVGLGLYGWWHWLYGNPAKRDSLPVRRTPTAEAWGVAVAAAATFTLVSWALITLTDSDVPYWDAFPTTMSLVAQYLITRKYLSNWAVWIFGVNLPYLALYEYKALPLIAGLQVVFIVLSVLGWRDWRRSMQADASEPEPAWSAA
jgi:nicotinamide mononucleotide transporter